MEDEVAYAGLDDMFQQVALLLGLPGQCVTVRFRGEWVTVMAEVDPAGTGRRDGPPVTDLLHLELLTGHGAALWWPRPVRLHAVITYRRDPVRSVLRASRWASYGARIAVAPAQRIGDHALAEAYALGVWLVGYPDASETAAGATGSLLVKASGEAGASAGSEHGLAHRLLDELIWEALLDRESNSI